MSDIFEKNTPDIKSLKNLREYLGSLQGDIIVDSKEFAEKRDNLFAHGDYCYFHKFDNEGCDVYMLDENENLLRYQIKFEEIEGLSEHKRVTILILQDVFRKNGLHMEGKIELDEIFGAEKAVRKADGKGGWIEL